MSQIVMRILSIMLFSSVVFGLTSCDDGCLNCTGTTAPRTICESDYLEKGDFQAEISAYEATGGTCD